MKSFYIATLGIPAVVEQIIALGEKAGFIPASKNPIKKDRDRPFVCFYEANNTMYRVSTMDEVNAPLYHLESGIAYLESLQKPEVKYQFKDGDFVICKYRRDYPTSINVFKFKKMTDRGVFCYKYHQRLDGRRIGSTKPIDDCHLMDANFNGYQEVRLATQEEIYQYFPEEKPVKYKAGDYVKLVSKRPVGWNSDGLMDHYLGTIQQLTLVNEAFDNIKFLGDDGWWFRCSNIERLATPQEIEEYNKPKPFLTAGDTQYLNTPKGIEIYDTYDGGSSILITDDILNKMVKVRAESKAA